MRYIIAIFVVFIQLNYAQSIQNQLDIATKKLLNSDAAYSANLSFYVTDEQGNLIYDYQGKKGLSTASTQKIFTAATALETLGKDFRWRTSASYSGTISDGVLDGNLFLCSNGDPTLGSWRYDGFKPEDFKNQFLKSIKNKGISKISGNLIIDDSYFDFQTIPGGWAWNDLGNYYGAGVWGVNWRENQFDILAKGKEIKKLNVTLPNVNWVNELKTAGTSDKSLVFTAPHSGVAYINGSLPPKDITVSGAMPNPPLTLGFEMKKWLQEFGVNLEGEVITTSQQKIIGMKVEEFPKANIFWEYQSPTLEKVVDWFMKKSVNLYGETLIKTIAKEKTGEGSFGAGVDYLKAFWKGKGINPYMINFADGSGLSPQNYASAKAEVQALLYAQKQTWYKEFYAGFPTQNGMKMKSGTMKNTKSFAGYHTAKNGKKYVFAIILNNYQANDLSNALFQVLNVLK